MTYLAIDEAARRLATTPKALRAPIGDAVRAVSRRGKRVLLIDFYYTDQNGSRRRYRHDATTQNMTAARLEAERLQRLAAETGVPRTMERPEGFPEIQRLPQSAGVYILHMASRPDAVKIGYSSNVLARVRHLDNTFPERLKVVGLIPGASMDVEGEYHRRFAASRIRNEWFRVTPDVAEFIASLPRSEAP